MRVKRRDSEQWMHHRLLPQDLRERVRRYDQYKWQETRGVDEENIVQSLPKDLRRDIKRHLCLALVKRVTNRLIYFQASVTFVLHTFYQFVSECRSKYDSLIMLMAYHAQDPYKYIVKLNLHFTDNLCD